MSKSFGLLAALVFLVSSGLFAQKQGTIKGFVYDKKSGEAVVNASVIVVNGKTGVQTDINGYFSLTLSSGIYNIVVTSLGYDSSSMTVNLLPEIIVSKTIRLSQKGVELEAHEVRAHQTEKKSRVGIGVTSISPTQLKILPSAGGEPDLAQYLQVIPGVVFTGDQGGQLYIRGGSPVQTGIYLDGVTIYNPFHSIGLFSVFETEAIRNVDVYTAGFGAQYGDRTSAVVDVHTKDGNKNEMAGLVSVSPIMSRVMLEGPIVKSKEDNEAGITYLITGKSSYLDQTSKSLYGGLGEPFSSGLDYGFSDYYGKVTFSGGSGSKLNVFALNYNDHASLLNPQTHQDMGDYNWKATGGGATFVVSPAGTASLIDGKLAFSNYNISLNQSNLPVDTLPRTSQINGFEGAINVTYFLPNYSQIKYGVEVSGLHTALSYYSSLGQTSTEDQQSTMAGVFVSWRKDYNDKLIIEPSIRLQYYSELNKMSPEPRFGIKYNLSDNVRFKAAAGVYSQTIISTKSDQDIVNLFTGFLLSPEESIYNVNGNPVNSNLQLAYHGVLGMEVDVKNVEFNLEPWYKNFEQVDELNRNKLFADQPDFIAASGIAYGTDLSAKYSYDRWYLSGSVGAQEVNYTSIGPDGTQQTYPTPFDTRLNTNLVTAYTAGQKKDWDISLRFNMHSPFPFTQTQGFYENVGMSSLQTNPLITNGILGVLYADQINGGRLSYYHRLDFSARKRFILSKKSSLDATFAITNIYDRNNIFYVDRLTNIRVYQLPLFPSVNLSFRF